MVQNAANCDRFFLKKSRQIFVQARASPEKGGKDERKRRGGDGGGIEGREGWGGVVGLFSFPPNSVYFVSFFKAKARIFL